MPGAEPANHVRRDLAAADAQDRSALDSVQVRWPLGELPVAVLDFETTGTDASTCWPVAFAIVHLELHADAPAPRIVANALVRPPVDIPPEAVAVHGITDAQAAGGRDLTTAVYEIQAAVEGRVLCAYNLPYEWTILSRLYAVAGMPSLTFFGIDPLVWVKHADKFERGKKLSDACARRGIPGPSHDAGSDAIATARLLLSLMPSADPEWRTVGDLWAWQASQAILQERSYAAWCSTNGKPAPEARWTEIAAAQKERGEAP